jgi:anti-repressor protein
MQELIKVRETGGIQAVSAKDLHVFLESKKDFSEWIKNRIEKYGFEDGKDFTPFQGKSTGGRPSLDYILTLDTAKEISMVEGNEKGKEARRYFLDCEAKLKALQPRLSPAELILQQAQQLVDHERKLDDLDTRVKKIEANQPVPIDHFTIMGYSVIKRTKIDTEIAKVLGKKATRLCQEKGVERKIILDQKYGNVGCYPKDVLEKVFNEFMQIDKNY